MDVNETFYLNQIQKLCSLAFLVFTFNMGYGINVY